MTTIQARLRAFTLCVLVLLPLLLGAVVEASVGDRLPEFKECVEVCERENCSPGKSQTPIPLHHRLLLWDCPSECDHTCQTIITSQRIAASQPVVQFHGKWPFTRVLGVQEPLSVLFSAANLWAHLDGLHKIRAAVPASYTLRPYYVGLARVGIASWLLSCLFHTRDLPLTESLDYLGAGASVLYGLYYTTIHHFRLDRRRRPASSLLHAWTLLCAAAYLAHAAYLLLWRWDYTYNMAANVACGLVSNALWTRYSWVKYRSSRRSWATWPGLCVAWVVLAMSLELFDFPPVLGGSVDAHCLWHLGTVGPTVLLYNFLVKDAQDDMAGSIERFKA
ncbi:hypothetical protein M406DRAFT_62983 [Cryphonectria parasitica EP155]|uniref:Post-GPI attachment to proteins factor 3 n=1 Tax=Cryphonectria parasitica (strain ATCC 38755 / EP155) TaxID=660469 RepID=A0A9P4YAC7_CRYP1|nr:uncharacterized protein M406DRAFT_62983 [Cryphonectria parasitica EP155]KAF3768990.1 hypothetical protein M406DRAFT_62983 [Cryphonectria parasitica EP155]